MIELIQLAVVAWLPGAVVFRLPVADRGKRAALDPAERLFWAVVISLAITLSIVLALAGAGRYSFERLLLADAGIAVIAAIGARGRLRLPAGAARPRMATTLPMLLVLVAGWRFFPPAEYIIGGKDPGVYMNAGIQIAQRGTLLYDDPVVASVPVAARDLFFPSHQRPEYYGVRFMGFFIRDPDRGTVVSQFPHLYPASIAVGYGVDGLTGARRAAGVWAALGLLAVYFAGSRLFGRWAGFAGTALLALHVVQVWYARYPNSEMTMQALLFAALLATARAHVDGDRFFAPLAGFLLGLLLFLRMDAALAIAGTVGGLALLVAGGGRWRWSFVGALAIPALLAALYLTGPLRAHSERAVVFVTHFYWWQYWLVFAAAALGVAGLWLASRSQAVAAAVRSVAPGAFGAALVMAAAYALLVRQAGGRLAAHDANALRTFTSLYLTLPGLVAAVAGWVMMTRRVFWRSPAFFVTFLLFSLFFFYKIQIVPEHFWMARRFVPVILPGALLLVAAAALSGERRGPSVVPSMRRLIGIVFIVALGTQFERVSRPVLAHVEYAGVIPRLEALASRVEDDDLLIVESRDAGTDVHTLATPLAYIYARNVLVLANRVPEKDAFLGFLDWAQSRYARVLFLGAGGTDLLSPRWGTRVVASERFRVAEYESATDALPRVVRAKQFDYTVYEFTPPGGGDEEDALELDVGTQDDLHVLRFHAKEEMEGHTFRWSRDFSLIILPRVPAAARSLTLWMHDGGRPGAAPPADVMVDLDDERLGTIRVEGGFQAYALPIPAALAGRLARTRAPVRLRLSTAVWRPEEVLGTPDDRDLGVMVDRVAVR